MKTTYGNSVKASSTTIKDIENPLTKNLLFPLFLCVCTRTSFWQKTGAVLLALLVDI
jgi:hypothetical protein